MAAAARVKHVYKVGGCYKLVKGFKIDFNHGLGGLYSH